MKDCSHPKKLKYSTFNQPLETLWFYIKSKYRKLENTFLIAMQLQLQINGVNRSLLVAALHLCTCTMEKINKIVSLTREGYKQSIGDE